MRILQITDDLPPFQLGGSGRIAWESSKGLKDLGHDVHILTVSDDNVSERDIEGIRVHTLPPLPRRFAHYRSVFGKKREREILAIIKKVQPDLIHAHGLAWHMGYRWISGAAIKHIPLFYTAHGVMHVSYGKVLPGKKLSWLDDLKRARWEWNPIRNALIRAYLSNISKIICVSDALREYLSQWNFPNMVTLRNGIDISFWKPITSQEEARKPLSLPTDKTIFLFAGRLGHDKGSSALIRTLPENAFLVAAGESDPTTFESIHDRVRFFPKLTPEQMRLLYAACDLALVPSVYLDPFPTVCLEAMACARPVIATNLGGAKEAVKDTETGWVLDPRNEGALRERLQWCTEHRSELPQFGDRARVHIEENFSLDRYLRELTMSYQTNFS